MKRFVVLDQVMPIVLDGKNHFLILKEASSFEELVSWVNHRSLTDKEYTIKQVYNPIV